MRVLTKHGNICLVILYICFCCVISVNLNRFDLYSNQHFGCYLGERVNFCYIPLIPPKMEIKCSAILCSLKIVLMCANCLVFKIVLLTNKTLMQVLNVHKLLLKRCEWRCHLTPVLQCMPSSGWWMQSSWVFTFSVTNRKNIFTCPLSSFTVIYCFYRSFIPNKTIFTKYCLTQWMLKFPRSRQIHWVRQYLVYFVDLTGKVNSTVNKTEPVFTGLGHDKFS